MQEEKKRLMTFHGHDNWVPRWLTSSTVQCSTRAPRSHPGMLESELQAHTQ